MYQFNELSSAKAFGTGYFIHSYSVYIIFRFSHIDPQAMTGLRQEVGFHDASGSVFLQARVTGKTLDTDAGTVVSYNVTQATPMATRFLAYLPKIAANIP
jgi:hypothetical protein